MKSRIRSFLSFYSFLALIFLFACSHRDERQYDTNHAEVVDNPGDLKRGDAETNEQAAKNSPGKASHPSDIAHPAEGHLPGEKSKVPNSFLVKAAEASMGEVALGEMAAEKTKNQRVMMFAKMMIKDHSEANKSEEHTSELQSRLHPVCGL